MSRHLPTAVLTGLLFYLETLNADNCSRVDVYCIIKGHLIEYRIFYALGFIALFTISHIWISRQEENKIDNNLNDFLFQFFENKLFKNKIEHRITIFERKRGASFFFGYLIHTLKRYSYYKKSGKLTTRLKRTPVPWDEYLVVHSRCGMPNENYKATIYKVSKNDQDTDSFIQYAYHTGQIEQADLPNICDIELNTINKLEDLNRNLKKRVETYMKKSKVKTFSSLKMFGRRAPYIAAIPLFTKKKSMNRPSHIIMFDSMTLSFKEVESELRSLSEYIEIILKNA